MASINDLLDAAEGYGISFPPQRTDRVIQTANPFVVGKVKSLANEAPKLVLDETAKEHPEHKMDSFVDFGDQSQAIHMEHQLGGEALAEGDTRNMFPALGEGADELFSEDDINHYFSRGEGLVDKIKSSMGYKEAPDRLGSMNPVLTRKNVLENPHFDTIQRFKIASGHDPTSSTTRRMTPRQLATYGRDQQQDLAEKAGQDTRESLQPGDDAKALFKENFERARQDAGTFIEDPAESLGQKASRFRRNIIDSIRTHYQAHKGDIDALGKLAEQGEELMPKWKLREISRGVGLLGMVGAVGAEKLFDKMREKIDRPTTEDEDDTDGQQ